MGMTKTLTGLKLKNADHLFFFELDRQQEPAKWILIELETLFLPVYRSSR